MNVITYNKQSNSKKIAYCFLDQTYHYETNWIKELVKNQSDYTVTNVYSKGYNIYQGLNEDLLLRHAANLGYSHAVVFSTGTEFINGDCFFERAKELTESNFFVAGHILDREEAYYELHNQCYVINLEIYKQLNMPSVGKQQLGTKHQQVMPIRSNENYHDYHTPTWVKAGDVLQEYNHKCHGWNILSLAFKNNLPVLVFDENIRHAKKHLYPENRLEFNQYLSWAYTRERYCSNEFVHKENTDWANCKLSSIQQVFTPASGIWWIDHINKNNSVDVVFYDYNQQSLDWWQQHAPKLDNISYKFIKLDLLTDDINFNEWFDSSKPTFINLSNIFVYEGTSMFSNLEYRLARENKILTRIKEFSLDAYVSFSSRAASGFSDLVVHGPAQDLEIVNLRDLTAPTWHQEWLWNS